MARILLTGFTAKQRGEGRPQVATLLCGVERALRHAGHHVERRKVYPDEDLRAAFDCAVVAVYDYRGTSATAQKFNTMRACVELPHVLAWDDWSADRIFGSMRRPGDFWALGLHKNDHKVQSQHDELRTRYCDEVNALCERWSQCIPRMLCCSFNWGDHDKLRHQHSFGGLCCWDPSPWVRGIHGRTRALDKKREWALASLWNHDDWMDELELSWDVAGQQKQPGRGWQIAEEQVVQELYAERWGVLSPPYAKLAGSGWWRNRFVFAADAGCVLHADLSEVYPALGAQSYYYWPAENLEAMPASVLAEVARKQEEELRSWELSLEDSAKVVSEFVLSPL